jgi:hypothetical protein
MIRVALQCSGPQMTYIEFTAVPLDAETDCRCSPDSVISLESIKQIARELSVGRVKGLIERYFWYRQAGS